MSTSLVDFSNNLADAVERVGKSVIAVLEGGREGVSGTVWREGIAVTAEHTIRGHEEVTVVLPSGEQVKGTVAGRDPGTDIAVLKLAQESGAAVLADESQLRIGEIVLSVGRRGAEGLATTYGVVSAIGGPWRTWHGARVDRWLRLDLNPFTGFSGGSIVNARGEVLGVATSGPRRSVMTIPTSTVTRVVDQLLQRGHISRGYLGVAMQSVAFPESARESLGLGSDRGLLVVTVVPGSSAEQSGILLGDIVVSVNGSALRSSRGLQSVLDPENVGKAVALEVVRGGKLLKLNVTVGERPGD
jgi:S1-C subfamily serine protease